MLLSLADRIRQARTQCAFTQAELARRVGVQRSAVAQWERHRHSTAPSAEHLIRIATVTSVYFEWLATGRGARRIGASESDTDVMLVEYAQDAVEGWLLAAFRRLGRRQREPLVALIELLAKSPIDRPRTRRVCLNEEQNGFRRSPE